MMGMLFALIFVFNGYTNNPKAVPIPPYGSSWVFWHWQGAITSHGFSVSCRDPVTSIKGKWDDMTSSFTADLFGHPPVSSITCLYGVWDSVGVISQISLNPNNRLPDFWWCKKKVTHQVFWDKMKAWYMAGLPKDVCGNTPNLIS